MSLFLNSLCAITL